MAKEFRQTPGAKSPETLVPPPSIIPEPMICDFEKETDRMLKLAMEGEEIAPIAPYVSKFEIVKPLPLVLVPLESMLLSNPELGNFELRGSRLSGRAESNLELERRFGLESVTPSRITRMKPTFKSKLAARLKEKEESQVSRDNLLEPCQENAQTSAERPSWMRHLDGSEGIEWNPLKGIVELKKQQVAVEEAYESKEGSLFDRSELTSSAGSRGSFLKEYAIQLFASSSVHYDPNSSFSTFLLKTDFTNVIQLDLSNSNITDNGANELVDALVAGRLPNLKSLDVSDNKISIKGREYFIKALQNLTQDIKILVYKVVDINIIIEGIEKQGDIFFDSKEEKQTIIKDFLKQAQDNGVDVSNVTVSKDIFSKLDNVGYLISDFAIGWVKCNVVPDNIPSSAADQIIATASKKAGVVDTVLGVVTCYFETFDEYDFAQEGVQFMHDIGLIGIEEFMDHVEI